MYPVAPSTRCGPPRARETLWRLSALAFAHPSKEFHSALGAGTFNAAFGAAWAETTGQPWPAPAPTDDFQVFEAGYIAAFLHGRGGKPFASLLAGDHLALLAGLSRPVFMLNVARFYGHFGLRAATGDEGRTDEPDHLSAMLEFMAVLCHLEARAQERGRDCGSFQRAQRDFLSRFLAPSLTEISACLGACAPGMPDPTLAQLVQDLARLADGQIKALEARTGPYRDPEIAAAPACSVPQTLWG
ncbi:DMSO reductase family type II enzyme chaperone [Rhodovulum imhoffii]|uniref:DMSO reductase family type II enzyme chaperone n=1 Tax=Rhodovulum imhoffii TaxID=365340 RepID=A0A2T5BPK9_9RHOB|nr:molecular chaperone TorD family protein [Rhodovulum imhoffii]MBK5932867.1 protein DdhD [Rhodovulum imhoffii]PTN00976.1 DMSO reductase family type II enzyme chaperone [Rhodovulum imhoffii]